MCKNAECKEFIFINTRRCPKCGFSNETKSIGQEEKSAFKKSEKEQIRNKNLIKKLKISAKIPKKFLDSVYSIKRNVLIHVQSHFRIYSAQPLYSRAIHLCHNRWPAPLD